MAHFRAEGGDAGALALRAATVAGVRHRLAGRGGEDAYAWAHGGDGLLVVAVADGVGSTERAGEASARAAATAATAGAALAAALPAGAPLPDLVEVAVGGVRAAAAALEAAGGPGSTTLVVVVIDAAGNWGASRVGDSTALVLGSSGWREVFADGGPGCDEDQVSTLTAALPADPVGEQVASGPLTPGEALVVVTDGVADPLRDGPETVAPALAAALRHPPTPLALAALADFSRQGCHDDRTVVGIWRLDGPPPAGAPSPGPPGQ